MILQIKLRWNEVLLANLLALHRYLQNTHFWSLTWPGKSLPLNRLFAHDVIAARKMRLEGKQWFFYIILSQTQNSYVLRHLSLLKSIKQRNHKELYRLHNLYLFITLKVVTFYSVLHLLILKWLWIPAYLFLFLTWLNIHILIVWYRLQGREGILSHCMIIWCFHLSFVEFRSQCWSVYRENIVTRCCFSHHVVEK